MLWILHQGNWADVNLAASLIEIVSITCPSLLSDPMYQPVKIAMGKI